MIWDSFLRFLVDLAWFAGLWVAASILFAVLGKAWGWLKHSRPGWRIRSRLARRHQPAVSSAPPPSTPHPDLEPTEWSAALLVRSSGRSLQPSVQLRGSSLPSPARLRIDLVPDGAIVRHRVTEGEVTDSDLGSEVALPPFDVGEAHLVDEALGSLWRVVLELEDRERVLCVERLRPMTGLTSEAEIGEPADASV